MVGTHSLPVGAMWGLFDACRCVQSIYGLALCLDWPAMMMCTQHAVPYRVVTNSLALKGYLEKYTAADENPVQAQPSINGCSQGLDLPSTSSARH